MAVNRARHSRRKGTPQRPEDAPSPAAIDIYFKTFAEDLSEHDARKAAGISRAQLAELKKDPAFLARFDDIRAELVDRVEDAAYRQAIIRGDKDLIKLILQAKRGEGYGAKAQLTLSVDVTKLSTEELDELIAKHNKRA